jgi:signal transduction histidine kinase
MIAAVRGMATVDEVKAVVTEHREQLIALAIEDVREAVDGYENVDETTFRQDVGTLVDAVVEMIGSSDARGLYQHQLKTATERVERGVTLDRYLKATLLGFPFMSRFAEAQGIPIDLIERALVLMVKSAGDAYMQAYDTHVKLLELERTRSTAETKRLRGLSELVAGVAHEINTPLGIISQASSMITDELDPQNLSRLARDEDAKGVLRDIAEAFALIQKNVRRIDDLVKSFKNLSIRHNTDIVDALDLDDVVEAAIATYRTCSTTKGLTIELRDHRPDTDRIWHGHAGYLRDIVVGLLANIERYAYDDGTGPVLIELSDHEDGVEVSIVDRGRGIPEADIDKVFEPFFTTGRHLGACGLGLAIVFNVVTQAMRGTVDLQSREGEGLRVTLNLPIEP